MTGSSDEYASAPQRLDLWRIALVALVAIVGLLYVITAASGLQNALARAVFPFADNQPGEWPLMLELHRFAIGQATYTPTTLLSAHDGGVAYTLAVGALRKLSGQGDDVVAYRFISMLLGLLAIVPLSFAGVAILERAGFQRTLGATAGVVVSTAALTIAVLSRSIAFDAIGPGNLEYLLVATAIALAFALASGRVPQYLMWALVADGVVCAFVNQNAVIVAPVLLAGLVVARVVTPRAFAGALATCVLGVIVGLILMPGDARAWTLLVPLAVPYAFSTGRVVLAWQFLTHWEPYLGMSLLAAAPAFFLVWKRRGSEGLAVDISAVAAVAVLGFSSYFKQLGLWDSLTLLSAATIPYIGALLGVLVEPRTFPRPQQMLMAASALLPLALAATLLSGAKQVPDARIFSQMDAARNAVREVCTATNGRVLVTVLPDLFSTCPSVQFALGPSYETLIAAYPRYYVGPTVYDKPTNAEYIVVSSAFPVPAAWRARYHNVVRRVPVVAGWGANYFPFDLLVIERS